MIWESKHCGIGVRIDIEIIRVKLIVHKKTLTFIINRFSTKVPSHFNANGIVFSTNGTGTCLLYTSPSPRD